MARNEIIGILIAVLVTAGVSIGLYYMLRKPTHSNSASHRKLSPTVGPSLEECKSSYSTCKAKCGSSQTCLSACEVTYDSCLDHHFAKCNAEKAICNSSCAGSNKSGCMTKCFDASIGCIAGENGQ